MIPALKDFFAVAAIVSAGGAAFSMLTLMGRAEPARNPALMRKIHAWSGRVFAAAVGINMVLGAILLSRAGDGLSPRAVLHWHIALALGAVFLVKLVSVKKFRQMLRWVPALGAFTFGAALVLVLGSAGFEFLMKIGRSASVPLASPVSPPAALSADSETGREIFTGLCGGCHAVTAGPALSGPGLQSVLRGPNLPVSRRPATDDNIRLQLKEPFRSMPSFRRLTEAEISALLAYLHTL
jgi:mono/diheme cytochrome c family protein